MTDRSILFSGPMVNAILEGRKSQTRRVLKTQPIWDGFYSKPVLPVNKGYTFAEFLPVDSDNIDCCLPYQVGDRLYVREAWRCDRCYDFRPPRDIRNTAIFHEADGQWDYNNYGSQHGYVTGKFRQGMHMPRWASRLTLVVTDVRVQRLKEMSREDAIAEGIYWYKDADKPYRDSGWQCYPEPKAGEIGATTNDAVHSFETLWNFINQARGFGWDANPWVVAVTFETHKCNIDQMEVAP